MFGSFPEDLLAEFKEAYAERQTMAIGYPQQSYSDKESVSCNNNRRRGTAL
jgi:hypothetical protein